MGDTNKTWSSELKCKIVELVCGGELFANPNRRGKPLGAHSKTVELFVGAKLASPIARK